MSLVRTGCELATSTVSLPASTAYLLDRSRYLTAPRVSGNLHINIIESPHMPSVDAVCEYYPSFQISAVQVVTDLQPFIVVSNRGRIALDSPVHTGPTNHRPSNPKSWGDRTVISQPDAAVSHSMQKQAVLGSVEGRFVQNSMGMLRVVGPDGELQNGLGIDGMGRSAYTFWWEGVRYTQPNAELRIVPL